MEKIIQIHLFHWFHKLLFLIFFLVHIWDVYFNFPSFSKVYESPLGYLQSDRLQKPFADGEQEMYVVEYSKKQNNILSSIHIPVFWFYADIFGIF